MDSSERSQARTAADLIWGMRIYRNTTDATSDQDWLRFKQIMDEDIPEYLDAGGEDSSGLMTIKNPDLIGSASNEPVKIENFRFLWQNATGRSKLESHTMEQIHRYERDNKASLDSDDEYYLSDWVLLADDRAVQEVLDFGQGRTDDNTETFRQDRLLLSSVGVLDTSYSHPEDNSADENTESGLGDDDEDGYNGRFRCAIISLGIFFNQIQTRDNEHVFWEAFDPNKGQQRMGVWLPT